MTAFDIYSALGNVSEELLEESELPAPKIIPKGILYMTAAAACFAVLAVGLRFAFNDSGIAAPEQGELETIGEIYPITADVTQYTSPQTTETTRSVTSNGLLTAVITDSGTDGEANADFTSKSEFEETTVGPTNTTVSMTITATMTTEQIQDAEETAIVPKWEDMSDLERYSYLDYNGATYSMTVKTFDESELTFLQNGEIYGFFDDYWDDDEERDSKRISVPCAFYKIKNVNENYMIAALTADGNYTAFQNFRYRTDSLGDYLEDIDFSNRYKLTTIHSEKPALIDDPFYGFLFKYDLPDLQQAVEKLLAENSEALPEINPPPVMDRYLIICGNDTFPTVRISDGGYICVLGKYFWIGEDQTESFMKYIEENAVKTEYDPHAVDDANETDIPE
ncbi:MAG: hypothetical protein HDT24_07320 [Ruminococcus sp.]|nr:hypothetical protein [Ruminococcus sp.]